jgi:predicted transposase/invertase (TIGR01784 family)
MVPGIDPKVDYAFKRLFGSPHNLPILTSMLQAVLRPPPAERLVHLELLNPFNDKDALDDKLSVVDVKARDKSGRQYTIEMQLLLQRGLAERILYYWARLYQSQLHEGQDYDQLQAAVSVVLLDDVLFRDEPDRYHWTFRLWDEGHRRLLTPHLAIHLLELPKFKWQAGEAGDALEQWLYFMRHAEALDTEKLPAALTLPEIRQALQELRTMNEIEQERERYEARLKAQRDARWFSRQPELARAEGLKEGLEKGRTEGEWVGVVHLCQRLLGRPLTPADQLLALPPTELQRLAEQLESEVLGQPPAQKT